MKISILKIIKDHYKTFYDFNTKRLSSIDYLIQLVLPIIGAFVLEIILQIELSKDLINMFITSLSIFAALLLNLLILMYTISKNDKDSKIKKELSKEITSNISYGIVLSIFLIIILVAMSINCLIIDQTVISILGSISRLLIWFGMIQFITTMLMILKRVYTILQNNN